MFARIPRFALQSTLGTMASLGGRVSGDAGWTFHEGSLTLAWAGGTRTFAGAGSGNGTVQVSSSDMIGIAAVMEASATGTLDIEVRAADGRLYLSGFSVRGVRLPAETDTVPQLLPVNASFRDVLRLPFLYDAGVVAAAGLASASEAAQMERTKLVREALSILEPIGVTAAALDACVDACLAREAVTPV
jgi:hypothetical protein